jgi:hypothetical protein
MWEGLAERTIRAFLIDWDADLGKQKLLEDAFLNSPRPLRKLPS